MSYPESEGLQVAVERDGLLVNPDHGGLEHYTRSSPQNRQWGITSRTLWLKITVHHEMEGYVELRSHRDCGCCCWRRCWRLDSCEEC